MFLNVAVLTGLAATLGCNTGGAEGVDPPLDRLFFPSAVRVDSSSRYLWVVNANTDLRYNAGTVVAVDLKAAAADRAPTVAPNWPTCAPQRTAPAEPPRLPCCRDLFDSRVLNCDDRSYVRKDATVRIGSFGSEIVVQDWTAGGTPVERLFVAVRSDPSITFIDATIGPEGPRLQCTGPRGVPQQAANPQCDTTWQIRTAESGERMPEEPYAFALDDRLGVLFVGHLVGGMSVIDVCAPGNPAAPRLTSILRVPFPTVRNQGVTAIALPDEGQAGGSIFVSSRFSPDIGELVLRGVGEAGCGTDAMPVSNRALALVGVANYLPTSFLPSGNDIRGFLLDEAARRAYVLHRNVSRGPAAIAMLDVSRDQAGRTVFTTVQTVEVCSGPSTFAMHDAGRGNRLFVTCFDAGQIYVVDPVAGVVTGAIDAGRGPSRLAFDPNDPTVAYVAGFSENTVGVIDIRPESITENRLVQRIGIPKQSSSR